MENIPPTMVLHNHVDGVDNRFTTIAGPLEGNQLEEWIGVIIRGTHQAASEDSRWAYEPVYDLWLDIEPDSDSSNDGSGDEGRKYQYNPENQDQKEVVLVMINIRLCYNC